MSTQRARAAFGSVLLTGLLLLTGCGASTTDDTRPGQDRALTVLAAASLSDCIAHSPLRWMICAR